ncbi:hypothetical protein [Cellulomonas sp. URHD0024]|uniref:hypothetical protein n=1 Tax=Cellulomonas sp. URHD0024 TaxID=1302620 RepID=UPI00040107CC|nr:hypothetical protein [Cellulomonas sp. URHD0024]
MSIDVHGGAGGMGARLQDLRSEAGLLDNLGDDVRRSSGTVAEVAVSPDVLEAAVLCPAEVAGVEAAVTAATVGPDGLILVSTGFEATAVVLRASATTYELVDEAGEWAMEKLYTAAGFVVGLALPTLAVAGGLAVLGGLSTIAVQPGGVVLLARLVAERDSILSGATTALSEGLYENPWLGESLTRMAPGLVQGTVFGLPGGPRLAALLSGGAWPTGDYEDAIAGLLVAGGLAGQFQDTGDVHVTAADIPATVPVMDADGIPVHGPDGQFLMVPYGEERHAPTSVEGIFLEQYDLYRDEQPDNRGEVQVVTRTQPDGTVTHIVQIPGTEEWSGERGANPFDLTSNLQLMAGHDTLVAREVAAAMDAAGIRPGEPVMLTGHSQGGIIAASLAADPAFRARYDVEAVVTGGSPIARFDIPPSVSVLALEHNQDVVPMLDGHENPDRPNVVTVNRDVPESRLTVATPYSHGGTAELDPGPTAAHDNRLYAQTGALVDSSTDPSVAAWRSDTEKFFGGSATVTRWEVTS